MSTLGKVASEGNLMSEKDCPCEYFKGLYHTISLTDICASDKKDNSYRENQAQLEEEILMDKTQSHLCTFRKGQISPLCGHKSFQPH